MNLVAITFGLIIILSTYFCFKKSDFFSLYNVFYLFSLFFFGIAPMLQYFDSSAFFGGRRLKYEEYLQLNIMILFIIIIYYFLYKLFSKKLKIVDYSFSYHITKSNNFLFFFVFLILVIKFLKTDELSLQHLLLRNINKETQNLPSGFLYIIDFLTVVMPGTLLLHLLFHWLKCITLPHLLLLLMLLFSVFPTSISRAYVAIFFMPAILLIFPKLIKRNYFDYTFIITFVYFFPFLDQFRNLRTLKDFSFAPNFKMFTSGHFDTYYNFALIFYDIPVQYGKQLLGVIFLFIPRLVWENKPVGSGAYMAKLEKLHFDNISANYFAEGYINFGYLGILLFLVIFALVTALVDKVGVKMLRNLSPLFILYLQIVFWSFYLLRGDLINSVAAFYSIVFSNIFVIKTFYSSKTF